MIKSMNASELAQRMLDWEIVRRQLDEIEAEIVPEIMERRETLTVGLVRATYSRGSRTFDYEQAGLLCANSSLVAKHTKPVTNWSAVCKDKLFDQDVRIPVKSRGESSVKLKLLEE
jgi:hypothetical protein